MAKETVVDCLGDSDSAVRPLFPLVKHDRVAFLQGRFHYCRPRSGELRDTGPSSITFRPNQTCLRPVDLIVPGPVSPKEAVNCD